MKDSVTISGQNYKLVFNFKSLLAMQETYGVNVMASETYKASPRLTAVLIWGGIVTENPKATLDYITAGIALRDLDEYGARVMAALTSQMPAYKEVNEPSDTPAN